jgi:hypothetical protein
LGNGIRQHCRFPLILIAPAYIPNRHIRQPFSYDGPLAFVQVPPAGRGTKRKGREMRRSPLGP